MTGTRTPLALYWVLGSAFGSDRALVPVQNEEVVGELHRGYIVSEPRPDCVRCGACRQPVFLNIRLGGLDFQRYATITYPALHTTQTFKLFWQYFALETNACSFYRPRGRHGLL